MVSELGRVQPALGPSVAPGRVPEAECQEEAGVPLEGYWGVLFLIDVVFRLLMGPMEGIVYWHQPVAFTLDFPKSPSYGRDFPETYFPKLGV